MLTPGEKVCKKRKALGLSMEQFATRCDCSNRTIYMLEFNNLRPNLITMLRICHYLKVDLRLFECSIDICQAIKHDPTLERRNGDFKRIPGRKYPGEK